MEREKLTYMLMQFSLLRMHSLKEHGYVFLCVNGEGWIQQVVSQPDNSGRTVPDQEGLLWSRLTTR